MASVIGAGPVSVGMKTLQADDEGTAVGAVGSARGSPSTNVRSPPGISVPTRGRKFEPATYDLVQKIRRYLGQIADLPPELAYFIATIAHHEAGKRGAGADLATEAASINDLSQLQPLLDGLPSGTDNANFNVVVDTIDRISWLVHPTNTLALEACVARLKVHIGHAGAGKTHIGDQAWRQCCETTTRLLNHPAVTPNAAEQLVVMQGICVQQQQPTWPSSAERSSSASMVQSQNSPTSSVEESVQRRPRTHLQPARVAPPLPPTTSQLWQPSSSNGAGTPLSSGFEVSGVATDQSKVQQRTGSSTTPKDRAVRVRSWLKTLRLHKYCAILEQMNYEDMVSLSESDLEKMGISAKGARTKMLKSIAGLRRANQAAAQSIAQYNDDIRAGIFADTIAGLTALLEPDQVSLHGPRPDTFDVVQEFMTTVEQLYTALIIGQSTHKPQQKDIRRFFQLLDKVLRHEHFPVESKKIIFSWKNDCQRVLQRSSGGNGGDSGVASESIRRSISSNSTRRHFDNPWTQSPRNGRSTGSKSGNRHNNNGSNANSGFESWSNTRGRRAASFRERVSDNAVEPVVDVRDRGKSFSGSEGQAVTRSGSPLREAHSMEGVNVNTSPLREARSMEGMNAQKSQSFDAFGFGTVSSIWGAGDTGPNADPIVSPSQQAIRDPTPPGPPGPPSPARTPRDIRHLWDPAGQPSSGDATLPNNQNVIPTFVPGKEFIPADNGGLNPAAVSWFQGEDPPLEFHAAGNELMQSIISTANNSLAQNEDKRRSAKF